MGRDLDAPPAEIVDVSKCRVRGCGVADRSFCYVDEEGVERHFCER